MSCPSNTCNVKSCKISIGYNFWLSRCLQLISRWFVGLLNWLTFYWACTSVVLVLWKATAIRKMFACVKRDGIICFDQSYQFFWQRSETHHNACTQFRRNSLRIISRACEYELLLKAIKGECKPLMIPYRMLVTYVNISVKLVLAADHSMYLIAQCYGY